jgi:hypothetical protein
MIKAEIAKGLIAKSPDLLAKKKRPELLPYPRETLGCAVQGRGPRRTIRSLVG